MLDIRKVTKKVSLYLKRVRHKKPNILSRYPIYKNPRKYLYRFFISGFFDNLASFSRSIANLPLLGLTCSHHSLLRGLLSR